MVFDYDETTTGVFIWFSDIHYDPFYGQSKIFASTDDDPPVQRLHRLDSYPSSQDPQDARCADATTLAGTEGCDSPFSLVRDSISAAIAEVPNPEFVLISGDFCYHRDYTPVKTVAVGYMLSEVANLMREGYPRPTPILPALGNNDFVQDYTIDVEDESSALLKTASDAFQDLFPPSSSSSSNFNNKIVPTFLKGGYYAKNIIVPNQNQSGSNQLGLTIIVLNTVIYSVQHQPTQTHILDPYGQFEWLNKQLLSARAEGIRIYIMGHIPPTVGSYRHNQFWHDIYLDRYQEIIYDYNDIVVAQLYGHLHTDEFRVLSKSSSSSSDRLSDLPPLLIAPALTPIYDNNPSFRMVKFDRSDFTIIDYETRFIDVRDDTSPQGTPPQWKSLPSFRDAYGVPDLSLPSLQKVALEMATVSGVLEIFLSRLSAKNVDTMCRKECRIEWKCTLQSSSRQEFDDCVDMIINSEQGGGSLIVLIVSMIFALFFTVFTVRCFYLRSISNEIGSVGLFEDDDTASIEQNNIPEIS